MSPSAATGAAHDTFKEARTMTFSAAAALPKPISKPDLTRVLDEWRTGKGDALGELLPLVYDELRSLARRHMAGERKAHTLQPTALVHEVYLRLARNPGPAWDGRRQFFAAAARLMKSLLVDHARARAAVRRGGGAVQLDLESLGSCGEPAAPSGEATDLAALDEALARLARFDRRKSRIVLLRFLAGMTIEEVAEALGVSTATVIIDTRLARAWLCRELNGAGTGA